MDDRALAKAMRAESADLVAALRSWGAGRLSGAERAAAYNLAEECGPGIRGLTEPAQIAPLLDDFRARARALMGAG